MSTVTSLSPEGGELEELLEDGVDAAVLEDGEDAAVVEQVPGEPR